MAAAVADRTRIIIGPMIAGLGDPDGPNGVCGW